MPDDTLEKKRDWSLVWRLSLSAIIVPSLIALFYFDNRFGETAPVLLGLCLLLGLRASWENVELLRTRSFQPNWPLTAVCSLGIILASWWPHLSDDATKLFPGVNSAGLIGISFSLSLLILFFAGGVRFREAGQSMETLGAELIVVSYVGVLLTTTVQLRWVAGADAGYFVLGSLVIAAKCGDIGAYTLGRLFGKRKMVPLLSPGKTWMGALGAVLASGLGGWAWLHWGISLFNADWKPCPWFVAVIYSTIIGATGLIGDLAESLIKRDVGQKDSAPLLPGFGGLLDLLDSVLYAGPVAYLLWQILPLVSWQ